MPPLPTNPILELLKLHQVAEKDILEYVNKAKSDLGLMFAAIGMSKAYKLIPYGSAVNGLFTEGKIGRKLLITRFCGPT